MQKVREFISIKKDKITFIVMLLIAWIGVYGLSYLVSIAAGDLLSNSIFSLIMYVIVFMMIKYTHANLSAITDKKQKRKRIIYALIIAWLFSSLMITGYQLKINGMTECGFMGKGLILLRGLCLLVVVFPFTNYIFGWIEKANASQKEYVPKKEWKSKNVFFIGWAAVFVSWIPVFLAYYPAVMAYDFHRQSIEAAKGFIWFNSYQPLAHTWLIWVALQIGYAVGSLEIGMACYSLFQMLVFSVACGYACATIYRLVKRKWAVVLTALFFGFFPLVSVLSVGATKDVLFSALFIIFMCLFVERTFLATGKKQWVIDVLWILEGIVMMLFRNNAIYAVAAFTILAFLLEKKKQKIRILILCLLLVVGGKAGLEGMQIVIGTEGRGSKVEAYSVVMQQLARVGYYHGDTMDEDLKATLDLYMPPNAQALYNPPLVDTVKWNMGTTYTDNWEPNMGEMIKSWIKIGLAYPNEYIDAFLELCAGYWFFDDVTWAEVFGYGLEERMGALSTYTSSTSEVIPEGIAHESKFPWLESKLEDVISANCFYDWPVISVLFKPALYCWGLLLSVIACIYTKKRRNCMVILLPFIYLGTMFLGPVVQARYALPIMVTLPVMMAVFAYHSKDDVKEEVKVVEENK